MVVEYWEEMVYNKLFIESADICIGAHITDSGSFASKGKFFPIFEKGRTTPW